MPELRAVALTQDLGHDLSRINDDEVIAEVQHFIERRGLRRCGKPVGAAEKSISARDQKQIAAQSVIRVLQTGSRQYTVAGHSFRIVRASQWRNLREGGGYQIVPIAEARQVIAHFAASSITPDEKVAWVKAGELLPESGAARFESGLLLLRVVPRRNLKSPSSEAPITPSQLARMVQKHWVAIELVDEDGNGVEGVSYSIMTPDNQEYTGVTDATGSARVDNIPAGQCKIRFPDLDKDAYKAA